MSLATTTLAPRGSPGNPLNDHVGQAVLEGKMLRAIRSDVLYAFHSMGNSIGFAITAILTLVVGIGAITAMFSVVYAVLLRPLPYREPHSLVHIVAEEPGDARSGVPYLLFETLRRGTRTLQQPAIYIEIGEKPRLVLILLMAAVGVVLLIACANVANLLLARGAARKREFAIRVALGASQARIVQQLLTESVVLTCIAAAMAVLLAQGGIRLLGQWAPADLPRLNDTRLDIPVLLFAFGISGLTAVLFGLGPAWRAARSHPESSLKGGGWGMTGNHSRVSRMLVVSEFALAVVLVTSAGMLLRSLWAVGQVDLGFQPSQVLTIRLQTPSGQSPVQRLAFFERVQERIKTIPGVESVGGIRGLFELGNTPSNHLRAVEGEPIQPVTRRPLTWTTVGGDFFQAMGIPLLAGRFFSAQDTANTNPVAVVDQSLARRYWPGKNPIGRRFKGQDRRGANDDWITVIGGVGNSRRQGVEREATPHVFLWHRQSEPVNEWVIRTATAPLALGAAVRAAVRDLDPRTVIAEVVPLDQQLERQGVERRFQTWLLTLFAGLALALAAIGIFGVMSHAATVRKQEIGVRMAVGADRLAVIRMILAQGMGLAFIGLCIGVTASLGIARLLTALLYGVTATDATTFISASALLLLVAASATVIPAWRAATTDPLVVLRDD